VLFGEVLSFSFAFFEEFGRRCSVGRALRSDRIVWTRAGYHPFSCSPGFFPGITSSDAITGWERKASNSLAEEKDSLGRD